MSPDRQCVVGGHKIAEYDWAGDMVVYVDGRLSGMPYDMACEHYRALADKPAPTDHRSE